MTEGYHANDKKTPQGAANVEVILFNHLMQERWKGQTEQWKETNRAMERANRAMERANRAMERANRAMERANRAMERILIPLKWQTKGSTTCGLLP
jgi:hypothetical protein